MNLAPRANQEADGPVFADGDEAFGGHRLFQEMKAMYGNLEVNYG